MFHCSFVFSQSVIWKWNRNFFGQDSAQLFYGTTNNGLIHSQLLLEFISWISNMYSTTSLLNLVFKLFHNKLLRIWVWRIVEICSLKPFEKTAIVLTKINNEDKQINQHSVKSHKANRIEILFFSPNWVIPAKGTKLVQLKPVHPLSTHIFIFFTTSVLTWMLLLLGSG